MHAQGDEDGSHYKFQHYRFQEEIKMHAQGDEKLIQHDGSYYKFQDVPGDGDCLFHALIKAHGNDLPCKTPRKLRTAIAKYVESGRIGNRSSDFKGHNG